MKEMGMGMGTGMGKDVIHNWLPDFASVYQRWGLAGYSLQVPRLS